MAFVYRTTNNNESPRCQTPGPGAYFNNKKYKNQPQQQCRVPFNQSQNRQLWKKTNIPGPGTYKSQSTLKKQKKLASDPTGQITVYESPSQSVPFKSKTIRFGDSNNSNNPGPGEYEVQSLKPKPFSASKSNNNISGSQLKQFLRKKNQSSKPQCQSAQLQRQIIISANNNLSFIENETQNNEPKQTTNTIKQNKNSVFFASKVERQINRKRPQTSLGPGSYNINKSSFNAEKNYEKKSPSKSIFIDRQIAKQENQELGPGYYEVDRAFKNLSQGNLIKKKKLQCFGSTVDRFQHFKGDIKTIAPGPAYYEFQNTELIKSLKKQAVVKSTFPKEQRIIFNKPYIQSSPITYQTEKNFSQSLKQKYNRNPSAKQCFGSTKSRFQENQSVLNQKSQQYHSSINLVLKKDKQNAFELSQNDKIQRKTFKNLKKSQQKKFFVPNESIQAEQNLVDWSIFRPFCYDTEANTLQSKYSKKVQKQAPFMSCAQRFKDNNSPRYIDLTSDPKNSSSNNKTQKKPLTYKSKLIQKSADNKKSKTMTLSKDSRFKYQWQKNKDLGPQYYDPVKPQKKSYNVLFA